MAFKTILVKGSGIRKEGKANAAITPGYLVEIISTGNIQKHAGAGLTAQKAFAVENDIIGKDIDTDYAINDNVLYEVLPPGCEVYAKLAANAAAIVVGSKLESAGDGTLRIATADAATDTTQRNAMVAVALEAVDNSAVGAEARILVETL